MFEWIISHSGFDHSDSTRTTHTHTYHSLTLYAGFALEHEIKEIKRGTVNDLKSSWNIEKKIIKQEKK